MTYTPPIASNEELDAAWEARWPKYPVGPVDSVYALGVVNSTFTLLEGIFAALFSKVVNVPDEFTAVLFGHTSTNLRLDLMKVSLGLTDWADEVKTQVLHFATGFQVCADNRNLLAHSFMRPHNPHHPIASEIKSVLTKTTKRGGEIYGLVDTVTLRRVSDDMFAYLSFGLTLQDYIWTQYRPLTEGRFLRVSSLPDMPAPVFPLEYKPQEP